MDPLARDLVEKMLQTKPEDRITVNDIKSHRYFDGIDFNNVSMEGYTGAKVIIE